MQCASLCMNNPDCYLFCVTGEICTLFDAAVTELWQGDYSEDALTFSACFSLTASSLQTFRDNNPDGMILGLSTTTSEFESTETPENEIEQTETPENEIETTETPGQ
ncbi:uncharacterized protein LOC119578580 isoform X2 [Penaeus monodon]|uniref:uncharacterized protein LOC119578580 isoform X2 n=1 Tax=Penaeus monodon TaxID=6687 RepID=UPI0018A7CF6E|nr:uncharacterized protein LOC119578580 isoform X2 [Penaeus monodon]